MHENHIKMSLTYEEVVAGAGQLTAKLSHPHSAAVALGSVCLGTSSWGRGAAYLYGDHTGCVAHQPD